MCVYVFTCMFECVCTCVRACVWVHIHARVCVCARACVSLFVCVRLCGRVHAFEFVLYVCACVLECACVSA